LYFSRQIDNSRLVKVADPREHRAQTRLVLMSLVLFMALLGAACIRFATVRAGYRIEELKGQREQLLEANRQFRLEEASLRRPERIDAIARRQLGFSFPAPGQVVRLEQPSTELAGTVVARAQAPARALP